ncbi:MAG: hypothetical protein ACI8RZ_005608 [Myxococcota bacterium]|jgi:hypothetical protein
MAALIHTPPGTPVLDTPARWRRDAALAGAVGALGCCSLLLLKWDPVALAAVPIAVASGALSGLVVGGPIRRVIDALRRRVSLRSIAWAVPILGATWGVLAMMGFLVGIQLIGAPAPGLVDVLTMSTLLGGPIGALLLGLLWLPHAVTAVMRLPRWPILAATLALSPIVAWGWILVLFQWVD